MAAAENSTDSYRETLSTNHSSLVTEWFQEINVTTELSSEITYLLTNQNTTMPSEVKTIDVFTLNDSLQETINDSRNDFSTAFSDSANSYSDYEYIYTSFPYPAFEFEKVIFLYIWEILVIITILVNIVVVAVFLQKSMRNPTTMILVAIAISDSLTGFITLPSYILVFMKYEASPPNQENSDDGCILSKDLCRFFMISKFSIFQIFHTVSIYLTVFLACQRYFSVAYSFRTQAVFSIRNIVIVCLTIFFLAPVLHIYQMLDEKAYKGACQWHLKNCKEECAYLLIIFFFRHFIPCVLLVTVTVLFIAELRKGERNLSRIGSNAFQMKQRTSENRRISLIVIIIVIVFLIPEVPYGLFMFIIIVGKDNMLDLKTNRSIEAAYELFLVLSFHANVYIYAVFNQRFRKTLKRTLIYPMNVLLKKPKSWSISSVSLKSDTRKTAETGIFNEITQTNLDALTATVDTKKDTAGATDHVTTSM